jgi:hypothetical protein
MESLRIHLFKDSLDPFVELLDAHGIAHRYQDPRAGGPMASGHVFEVLQSAAMWGALATVIVAFINRRRGRKVIITTKDGMVVHAEGLSTKEIEKVIGEAKSLTAIDSGKDVRDSNSEG